MSGSTRIQVVDSHTGGEPTRVVISGFPELNGTTMAEKRADFSARFDHLRRGLILEPRGSDIWVGALLLTTETGFGTIFFNDVGMLGMCGHGTIGLVETLHHLGRLTEPVIHLETPVGTVRAERHANGEVTLQNVAARAEVLDLAIEVPGVGRVVGDIAYGGNYFFLVRSGLESLDVTFANRSKLLQVTTDIRQALIEQGYRGENGQIIDHVEVFGPPTQPGAKSKNFVLCPGTAFDRSPCGTGTSAKVATLVARGELKEGEEFGQESITGSIFYASFLSKDGQIIPSIRGRAHVIGESTLIFDESDPLRWGVL